MKFLTRIAIVFLLPLNIYGQTVHIDEDRIVYKGTVDVANASQAELYSRAKDAIQHVKAGKKNKIEERKGNEMIVASGKIKLATPYHIIRTVHYIFELTVEDGKYKYRIDSVYMTEKERGGKTITLSSEKMLKAVEETGPVSIEAEKQLNEVDMNFQKIIALVNGDMKKSSVAKGD